MDYISLADKVISGYDLTYDEACALINTPDSRTLELIAGANKIRQAKKGGKVKLCAIINAKSGKCSENCSFCAQSAHHRTNVRSYPLLPNTTIASAAQKAEKQMNATCFSIVSSGKGRLRQQEVAEIIKSIQAIKDKTKLNRCVSLGMVSKDDLAKMKQAGLSNFHHNLETARSYFDKVCTTHTYNERVNTIKTAKEAGLKVCSGGIFNLGESLEQRVELAMTLKELDVDQVPINILHPIPGTPAADNHHPIPAFEVLRIISAFRFVLPDKDIGLFGGRESALGELQPLMYLAGANVTLIGDYLTIKGDAPSKDHAIIRQLGLEVDGKIP